MVLTTVFAYPGVVLPRHSYCPTGTGEHHSGGRQQRAPSEVAPQRGLASVTTRAGGHLGNCAIQRAHDGHAPGPGGLMRVPVTPSAN